MTILMVRARGRHPEAKNVARSDYPEIFRLHQENIMCAHDIGEKFGIGAAGVRSLIKRCKENPRLLESKK